MSVNGSSIKMNSAAAVAVSFQCQISTYPFPVHPLFNINSFLMYLMHDFIKINIGRSTSNSGFNKWLTEQYV